MNLEELKKYLKHLDVHRASFPSLKEILIWLLIINGFLFFLQINDILFSFIALLSIIIYIFLLYSFRNPERHVVKDDSTFYAPADGKILRIQTLESNEFFEDKRTEVTISISPFSVHVLRVPTSGEIIHLKNNQTKNLHEVTLVLSSFSGANIVIQLYAKYLKNRIVIFNQVEQNVQQGNDLGLIKFWNAEMKILLPGNADLKIKTGDIVKGNSDVLARLH